MKFFKFSQRIGKTPIRQIIQIESIDDSLKIQLWNIIISNFLLSDEIEYWNRYINQLSNLIRATFFKEALDMPPRENHHKYFHTWFFNEAKWYEVYDFLEYLCELHLNCNELPNVSQYITNRDVNLAELLNQVLEEELSGYRIVNNRVIPISSDIDIESINHALINSDKYHPVNTHLKTAIEHLSNKKNPDYRNSIKESISAIEALCKIITNEKKATLGEALKKIESKMTIHSALKEAFIKIYGYTSDADGIRHALLEGDSPVTQAEAIFMLVACSAFVNYSKLKTNT